MAPPGDRDRTDRQPKLPRNRARVLILATIALILIVVFGYLLLVGQLAG